MLRSLLPEINVIMTIIIMVKASELRSTDYVRQLKLTYYITTLGKLFTSAII